MFFGRPRFPVIKGPFSLSSPSRRSRLTPQGRPKKTGRASRPCPRTWGGGRYGHRRGPVPGRPIYRIPSRGFKPEVPTVFPSL